LAPLLLAFLLTGSEAGCVLGVLAYQHGQKALNMRNFFFFLAWLFFKP
jgi:hypothetical protein